MHLKYLTESKKKKTYSREKHLEEAKAKVFKGFAEGRSK